MMGVEAVIFDWAGTTVDWGSLAPVRALTALFAHRGIQVSDSDVRRDMGLFKKDHIRRILSFPHVGASWHKLKGRAPNEDDVETIFTEFMGVQMEILDEHSQLIPGVAPLTHTLRTRGLKLGSTTGYTRPMLEILLARAKEQGYEPDLSLCPDDVGASRPYPWMCLRLALSFGLSSTGITTNASQSSRRRPHIRSCRPGVAARWWRASRVSDRHSAEAHHTGSPAMASSQSKALFSSLMICVRLASGASV